MNYNTKSKLKSSSQGPASFRDEPLPTNKGFRGSQDLNLCPAREGSKLEYEDVLCTRIRILEGTIHDSSLKGDSKELRRALKEYALTWIELARGFLCKQ